jgi:hypothetical protein
MPTAINITGQRFSHLVVIRPTAERSDGNILWLCQCDCGNVKLVTPHDLLRDHVRSCGCRSRFYRHGYARDGKWHPLYGIWKTMIQRCYNPNNKRYKNYGGRGIKAPQWLDAVKFIADVVAEIGDRPPGHSLDRVDNDGNYEPGNIKWSTPKEQAANRRPRSNRVPLRKSRTVCC